MKGWSNRMHSYADALLGAVNIACKFNYAEGLLKEKLPVTVKQHLYLIFKELMNNVVKHSGAANCLVELTCKDNVIYLSVKDDGVGFDPSLGDKGRNGLTNLQERAEKIRGGLQIISVPGGGTELIVSAPLPHSYSYVYKKITKLFNK